MQDTCEGHCTSLQLPLEVLPYRMNSLTHSHTLSHTLSLNHSLWFSLRDGVDEVPEVSGQDDCKTVVSKTYRHCGLRDVLEYYSQPPFAGENTSMLEVVFYSAVGKGGGNGGNDQLLGFIMEHREYLRGMVSHCYALEGLFCTSHSSVGLSHIAHRDRRLQHPC